MRCSSCAMVESCSVEDDISSAEDAADCVSSFTPSTALATCFAFALCCSVAAMMLWLISFTLESAAVSSLTAPTCCCTDTVRRAIMSFTFWDAPRICSMAPCEVLAVSTPLVTFFTLSRISASISLVEEEERSASLLTSSATTANPLP